MICIAMLALALATLAPGTADTTEVLVAGPPAPGQPAPWLAGWTLNDTVWNLSGALADTTARRSALVFWATWCAPCQAGLERLAAAHAALASAGVRVVLVNLDARASTVERFLAGRSLPFTCVLDPFQQNSRRFFGLAVDDDRALALPRTVLVDRDGLVELVLGSEGRDYLELLMRPPAINP